MKDFLRAISDAEDAIRLRAGEDHRYCNLRGYAYKGYGNRQKAIEDLRKSPPVPEQGCSAELAYSAARLMC
jgi:hypothetical protein